MKALVICPTPRENAAALAATGPLVTLPLLGQSLIARWMRHLGALGAREVLVLTTDDPRPIRQCVQDGARWGLRVDVLSERRELSRREAFLKYRSNNPFGWLPEPCAISVMDHLPGHRGQILFATYESFYRGAISCIRSDEHRLRFRELSPGVQVHRSARVSPAAKLIAPCWIGEGATIGPGAVVGPGTVLEEGSYLGAGCEVSESIIGPRTFIGADTTLDHSLAWGSLVMNWKCGSWINVSDRFLCAPLWKSRGTPKASTTWGRLAAAFVLMATLPVAAWAVLKAKWSGMPAFQSRVAVRPHTPPTPQPSALTLYELTAFKGWLRRWPQLWNVVRGDLAWLGHPPLSLSQAAGLADEFARARLHLPVGLISLADDIPGVENLECFAQDRRPVVKDRPAVRIGEADDLLRVDSLTELSATNASAVGDACMSAWSPRHTIVELDLKEVCAVDAAGAAMLLALNQRVGLRGGRVRLCRPSKEVWQFLELVRLPRVLEVVDGESEALRSRQRDESKREVELREAAPSERERGTVQTAAVGGGPGPKSTEEWKRNYS